VARCAKHLGVRRLDAAFAFVLTTLIIVLAALK
jgi:hypothetical protein